MNVPDFVAKEVDLSHENTFRLPARAAYYAKIHDLSALSALAAMRMPYAVLGGGSNILLPDYFEGLIFKIAFQRCEEILREADAIYLKVGAGLNWSQFVDVSLNAGVDGLENLSLIPGTVGAAPIQNIGAYGLEVGECIHEVHAFDMLKGEPLIIKAKACAFGYRDSLFKHAITPLGARYVITHVVFRLAKPWQARLGYRELAEAISADGIEAPDAKAIANAVIKIRQQKLPDPAVIPNVGSFFKNPIVPTAHFDRLCERYPGLPSYPAITGMRKLPAGWLIERAGWKGRDLGPVGMYEKQALVMVNRGGARREDVERLMAAVIKDVQAQFDVCLQPEPVWLGA